MFPCDRYETDVTFKQLNRPGRKERIFYGKHKLYGYNVYLFLLPIGLENMHRTKFPGSMADLEIMHHMRNTTC